MGHYDGLSVSQRMFDFGQSQRNVQPNETTEGLDNEAK